MWSEEGRGVGGRFFIENPRRGGGVPGGGEGGARGAGGCLQGDLVGGGGGLNISFRGRNARQGVTGLSQTDYC